MATSGLRGSTSASVRVNTVDGDIRFEGAFAPNGNYGFKTHDGDIVIRPVGTMNATVTVSTWSGEFESAMPVTINGSQEGKRFSFTARHRQRPPRSRGLRWPHPTREVVPGSHHRRGEHTCTGIIWQASRRSRLTGVAATTATAQGTDWNWKGAVASGKTIEIKGVNGDVRATAGSGSEVVVTAVKKGKKSDPASVSIEVVNSDAGVTICAVYPSTGKRANKCGAGRRRPHVHQRQRRQRDTSRVQVPAGVKFAGNTVNGSVSVERPGGRRHRLHRERRRPGGGGRDRAGQHRERVGRRLDGQGQLDRDRGR